MRGVCQRSRSVVCLLVLGGLAGPAALPAAAGEPPAAPVESAAGALRELDEVVVRGRSRANQADLIRRWFARISGKFEISGSLRIQNGKNPPDQLRVTGRSACMSYFPNPGAQCELHFDGSYTGARDAAGSSAYLPVLNPAVILLGYGRGESPVLHLLVDAEGAAEHGAGDLHAGTTLITHTKCAGAPADCRRTLRITAEEDSQVIAMIIGTEVASMPPVSLELTLRKVAALPPASP